MRDAFARDIETIERDIAAAKARVAQLEAERGEAFEKRRTEVVKAFDDGASRLQLVTAFNLTYQVVNNVLSRAGRNERQRQAIGLTPAAGIAYQRLIRCGMPSKAARETALAIQVDGQKASQP